MNFFKEHGHLVVVEGKKTYEENAFSSYKNVYAESINFDFNPIEAKPYIAIYEYNKQNLLNEFNRSNFSRRMVLNFDNAVMIADEPNCMMLMQFFYRTDCISVITYARSTDIKKFFDDIATTKFILQDFCKTVNKRMGTITFFSGSFHQYI